MTEVHAAGQLTAALSSLYPDPLNPRRARAAESVKAMIASIGEKAERLRTPLLVRQNPKTAGWLVADGETRRLALEALAKAGAISADHRVPIAIIAAQTEAEIREAALSVNERRFGLHPVEQFEAIAACDAAGLSRKDIAARFSITERQVTQRLALGGLAPAIRDAWLEDEINDEAAEAFTLTTDQGEQVRVFAALKKRRSLHRWAIREALTGDVAQTRKLLKTVGVKAYEAAGGAVVRDLFAEGKDDAAGVSDFGLLQRLAGEAVDKKIEALKAEGFAWADRAEKHPGWRGYQKSPAKTKAEKAKSGAVVWVEYDGALQVSRGLVLAKAKKPAKKKPGDSDAAKELPFGLVRALSVARTKALQTAVARDIDLALRLLVATLDHRACADPWRGGASPSTLRHDGYRDWREDDDDAADDTSFEDRLAAVAALPREALLKRVAAHVAASVNMEMTNPHANKTNGAAAIDACDEVTINEALEKAFDAKGYFEKAGKGAALAAIAECEPRLGEQDLAALAKKKAGELAAIAADKATAQGWLPAPLRYARYCGPAAKPAAAPAAAKAAKAAKPAGNKAPAKTVQKKAKR